MVKGESKAKYLCISGLQFEGIPRVVERYWKTGLGSVCMIYWGIGHEQIGSCGNQAPQCIIYSGLYKFEDHCCDITVCNKRKGKIYAHMIVKCANCRGSLPINVNQYI